MIPQSSQVRAETQPVKFAGIGARLIQVEGETLIVNVLKGGPADKAGLGTGDRITSVSGKSTSGRPLTEIVEWIRGPAGSSLTLTIVLEGRTKTRDVKVTRRIVTSSGALTRSDRKKLLTLSDRGTVWAQQSLGRAYYFGEGVEMDKGLGISLLHKAADSGDSDAQFLMGRAHVYGDIGGAPNPVEASKWFERAVEQGNVSAMLELGHLYLRGSGVVQNYEHGLELVRGAASKNHLNAYAYLAGLYEKGEVIDKDLVQAYRWYLAANVQGDKSTAEALSRIKSLLTREQIEKAQALAAERAGEFPATAPAPSLTSAQVDLPNYRMEERAQDYALVIGIEQYAALPDAQFAQRDAEAMAEHLRALGFPPRNVITLTGTSAVRSGIKKYLESWLPRNVGASSRVYFYFSGHGAPDVKTGASYIIPWDGDPAYLEDTAYPVKHLYAKLNELKAKEILVTLDACFSGAGGRSVLAKGTRPLVTRVKMMDEPESKITLLTAAAGDEITSTVQERKHGTFTYYLLQGLNGAAKDGKGRVTARSLYEYLKPNVQDEARRQNRSQTPVFFGNVDIVLRTE